jgi:hypothetical protein
MVDPQERHVAMDQLPELPEGCHARPLVERALAIRASTSGFEYA